ncbi:MAG: hypothetical protein WCH34_15950, partial [Bacteroidota bacterium]
MKTKFLILGFIMINFMSFCQVTITPMKTENNMKEKVFGYEFLNKIPGLWSGPVTSSTSAGSFPIWYVDFRPISAAQVSQFSMLDSNTVNDMSFFIVKHNNQLKIALRTEGCFKDKCCVTYEVMDSVN